MSSRLWPSRFLLAVILCVVLLAAISPAQPGPGALPDTAMPSVLAVPPEAQAGPNFNVDAATDAYLAQIPADKRAKSDAYFEGGYWLISWDFLIGVVVCILILNLRWSAAMRNLAERIRLPKLNLHWPAAMRKLVELATRAIQTFLYFAMYFSLATILTLPMTVYEGYSREHKYGLATQTFGPWFNDQFKFFLVNLVLVGIITVVLFEIVRKLPRTWWIWGAIVAVAFNAFVGLIAPVYIFPIFNKITPLNDPKITQPILSMARANGIVARDVYQIDASKQTTRMSANVSGMGNTMRITLNDNLLRRGSPEEIQSVMGHEMGHYVLDHVYSGTIYFGIVIVVGFAFLRWGLDWSLQRWGERWQIRGIGDTAVLPLVVLLASIYFFVLTPVLNTIIRVNEHQADMYGINASRQPDGFAQAAIHLGEYRKMSPGPVEEWIFFDHPSGRRRIHDAMQWKAENMTLVGAAQGSMASPVAP